ncbi:MAG: hypothetical protein KAI47_15620 [Deltaproteobacteria bacterium]|nr:hypothetical protein [Deltaproteobacteria bacterium]
MWRTIALTLALGLAFTGTTTTISGCKSRHDSKYKKYKKHKKHKNKKYKKHKNKWKGSAPEISIEEARKSAEGVGKRLFKAAFKGDFDKLKGLYLKADDAKAFAKAELFAKWASVDKMREKLGKWHQKFDRAKFKKTKIDETMTIEPGKAPKDKWKILADNITKAVTIKTGKVFGKRKDGNQYKCSYVAIKLGEGKWRLLRIKSCKTAS